MSVNDAFNEWHGRWWRNAPNTVMRANVGDAFRAGWDAANDAKVKCVQDLAYGDLVCEAREFLAAPNLGKSMARELDKAMIHIRRLADALEASEARIAELEEESSSALDSVRVSAKANARWRRIVRGELAKAEARVKELEAQAKDHKAEQIFRISELQELGEAQARIAEVAKLHRKYTYYEHEDSCPDTSEKHREDHHHESDEIGEFYCDQMPTGDVCCDTCRDENGDRMDWPCETAKILGIEGGDNPSKTA